MAFSTTSGHFEYCMMPYGLSLLLAVFQCLINNVLWAMLVKLIIAYINNILIYTPDLTTHVQHMKTVLSRLLKH